MISSATRASILHAFVGLLFDRRYDAIRAGDIIAASGVGRSTFYNHFKSKDDVLLAVIEPIFTVLADAAVGRANRNRLVAILEHIWEQRATGRLIFTTELMPRLQRKLAAMIQARWLPAEPTTSLLVATGRAASQLAMLHLWITGGVSCPTEELAVAMTVQ